MMSQCHPQSVQQKKVLLVLDNPHGSRIYFFQVMADGTSGPGRADHRSRSTPHLLGGWSCQIAPRLPRARTVTRRLAKKLPVTRRVRRPSIGTGPGWAITG